MSDPISILVSKSYQKCDILDKIFIILENTDVQEVSVLRSEWRQFKNKLDHLYTVSTIGRYDFTQFRNEYVRQQIKHSISNFMIKIIKIISKYYKQIDKETDLSISNEKKKFDNILLFLRPKTYKKYTCPTCNIMMKVEAKTSEIVCDRGCGYTQILSGVIFEEVQFYFQEGQRSKHGHYDPTKHCKFWIDRIQAKEPTKIKAEVLNYIVSCIKRDGIIDRDTLTCEEIRSYLRDHPGYSTYNEHVPLIRYRITGKMPSQLTYKELSLIYMYFKRCLSIIYNLVKFVRQFNNCPYHPYFIYKIIENILPEDTVSQRARKQEILQGIHLQSRETLIKNDNIWEIICNGIEDFTYKPTYRHHKLYLY